MSAAFYPKLNIFQLGASAQRLVMLMAFKNTALPLKTYARRVEKRFGGHTAFGYQMGLGSGHVMDLFWQLSHVDSVDNIN